MEKTLTKKMLDEVSESHYHEPINIESNQEYNLREMESAQKLQEEE